MSHINEIKNILAIECSTELCSIALRVNGQEFATEIDTQGQHAEKILGIIDDLLIKAGKPKIDYIAFGQGPGSFTGVRLGASVAQALGLAWDVECIGISSLQILAQGLYREYGHTKVLIIQDAKMQQLYHGEYELREGLMQAASLELTCAVNTCNLDNVSAVAGSGLKIIPNELVKNSYLDLQPHASDLLSLAAKLGRPSRLIKLEQPPLQYL